MTVNLRVLFVFWSLCCWQAVHAQWTSQLEAGGTVSVDPTTNRATVTRDGVSTPLWDGVHRLQDGSAVTVRSGQVVPNEAILRARKPQPPPTDQAESWVGIPIVGASPCEQLVQRVCGATNSAVMRLAVNRPASCWKWNAGKERKATVRAP